MTWLNSGLIASAYTIPGWESVFVIEAVNEPLQQWQSDALPIRTPSLSLANSAH